MMVDNSLLNEDVDKDKHCSCDTDIPGEEVVGSVRVVAAGIKE